MDQINLRDVVKDIAFNEGIHDLLSELSKGGDLREHPYKKFVKHQRDMYEAEGLDIETEGFQIGEPWCGDIGNARVAFVSSNPAFDPCNDFPRYHAKTKTVSMPGGKALDPDDIVTFCNERFENALVRPNQALAVKDAHGANSRTIPYWGSVRNSIKALWPNAAQSGDTTEAYVKRLMSKAVCLEVVPFKSGGEAGVREALVFCLKNFTRRILPHVAAPIIVLVGKIARSAFLDFYLANEDEWDNASRAFNKGEVYRHNGKLFVAVVSKRGRFKLEGNCSEAAMQAMWNLF